MADKVKLSESVCIKHNVNFFLIALALAGLSFTLTSCDTRESLGLQDSLDVIPELSLIEGAENSNVTVSDGTESYFTFDVANINANKHISEGASKGWCIVWDKPIASGNTTHSGLRLYSSYGDEQWKPLNYLLNIRESLINNHAGISYREIQAAIWSLMDFPEFNLNNISIGQLPSRMVRDGQYNFDREKVHQIVKHVRDNYESFEYSKASTYAVVAETPSDTQTIIIEVSESAWAYGQHSFGDPGLRDLLGIKGEGKGQWGWIYEMDSGTSAAMTELIAGGSGDDGTQEPGETGTIIGSLEISKSASTMDVTYNPFQNYLVSDLHLWVGCSLEEFPWVDNSGAISPGGTPYTYDAEPVDSHTFSISPDDFNCPGNIFVAAHAGKLYLKTDDITNGPNGQPVFTIKDLSETYGFSVAWDINDPGHIAGGNLYWNSDTETVINMGNIFARSLNNLGQVVGDWSQRAVKWESVTGVSAIGQLDADQSVANDINIHGQVVGELMFEEFLYEDCYYIDDEEEEEHCEDIYDFESVSFVWTHEDGTKKIGSEGWAHGNNDHNTVVGVDFTIQNRAYIWDEQIGMRSLGTYPGFSAGNAYSINNQRQVTGSIMVFQESDLLASKAHHQQASQRDEIARLMRITNTKGIYDYGHVAEMIRNSTFEAEAFPWAKDNGELRQLMQKSVTGDGQQELIELAQNATYQSEAFIWDDEEGMVSLGTLDGNWATAWDINDHGQVVGYGDIGNGEHRAFYWDSENGMIELPTLGGNSLARAINNKGQIVGYSYDGQGNFKPVKWVLDFE